MAASDREPGNVADVRFGIGPVADPTAPTTAEVTALTAIECGLIDGTLDRQRSANSVDITGLCDTTTRALAGRITQEDITGTAYRELDGTDAYWALFDDQTFPKVTQYLAVCIAGFTGVDGAPADGDIIDLYTVQVAVRSPVAPDGTESQRFDFTLTSVADPTFDVALTT